MAEGVEAALLAAAASLPLRERAKHKNWKARVAAFEDIAATSSSSGSRASADDEAGHILASAVADSNAAAQDKALDALLAWTRAASDRQVENVAEAASSTICSKCLKARPATVSRAVVALAALVEAGCGEAVLAALLPATLDKVPKASAAAVEALRSLLAAFGPGQGSNLPLQPVFRALPALFGSKTGAVREGAKATAVELARWRGAAAAVRATLLPAVPAAARAEVEKAVAEAEAESAASNGSSKQPERFTRAEAERRRRKRAEAEAAAAAPMEVDDGATATTSTATRPPSSSFDDDDAPSSDPSIDPHDLGQPVDVLGSLPKTFWSALKAAKWSERRAALQQLREAAAAPGVRLSGAGADFTEICRALKSIISKDSNAAVVAEAGLVAAALATGARREFSNQGRMLLAPLLTKLRDKQGSVCAAAAAGTKAILVHCCSGGPAASEVAEEISAALTGVSPKGRALAAGVFAEAVSLFSASTSASSSTAEAAASSAERALSPSGPVAKALAKCASDADPAVRAAAVGALAALARAAAGPRGSATLLDKLVAGSLLDARTRAKVDAEAAATATSATVAVAAALPRRSAAASSPVGPPPVPAAAAALASAQRARVMLPPSRSSSASAAASSPALSRKQPPRASAAACSSSSADDSAPFEPASMSASEAEAFLEAVLGPGGGSGEVEGEEAVGAKSARSGSWKARLAAMDALLEAVSSSSLPDADLHLVPACLSMVPGWSDSNFQVVARALAVVAAVAERCSSSASAPLFPTSAAAAGALGAAEKLGDPKLKPAAVAALDALSRLFPSSGCGPSLVLSVLKARATSASKKGGPKLPAEGLRWAALCVADFGAAGCCFGGGNAARRNPPPPPRFLMAWARQALDAPQPEVRSGGTALLCALHVQCGPSVGAAIKEWGLKPAAAASLEAALGGSPFDAGYCPPKRMLLVVQEDEGASFAEEKEVERRAAAAAPRATAKQQQQRRAHVAAAAQPSVSDKSAANPDDDALLPRKDISSVLTPALFARFCHPNWKERNAALGEVEDAVEGAAGGRGPSARRVVSASGLGALPAALAERASRDANANISARAFCVATTLSMSMRGPDFDRVSRPYLLAPALSALGDKKRAVRDAAGALLDAWAAALPADKLLPAVCDAACGSSSNSSSSSNNNKTQIVISSGSEGRAAALLWLARAVGREALKKKKETSTSMLSSECVAALVRAAGRGWADKAASAREGGIALASALGDCSRSSSLVNARALVAAANRLAAAPAREAAREVLKRAGVVARADEEEEEEEQLQRRAPATPSVAPAAPPPVGLTPVAAAQRQQRTPGSVSALGAYSAAAASFAKTPAPPTTTELTATPVASSFASARRLSAPTPAPPPTVVAAPAAVYADEEEEEEEEEFRTASSDEEEEDEEDPVASWDAALADLHAPDPDAAIEGIKFLLRDLGAVAAGTAPVRLTERCVEDADALVAELARRVDPAFDDLLCRFQLLPPPPGSEFEFADSSSDLAMRSARGARTAKYVLNALLSAFAARSVARAVRPRALRAAAGALLGRLLDDALPRAGAAVVDSNGLTEGATLLKALNVLMLRVLDSSHPDAAFAALLALLRSPPARVRAMAAMTATEAPSSSAPPRNHRFDDLVVKCLAKLARNLRESLPAMDPAALLLAVHECLESLNGSNGNSSSSAAASSPASSSSSDRPARAVKALLLEMCRARGAEAMRGDLEEAGLLPAPSSASSSSSAPRPLVVSLVDLHLRTLFGPSAGVVPVVAAPAVAAPVAAAAAAAPAPPRSASFQQEQVPPPRSSVAVAVAAASASTPVAPRAPSSSTATKKTPSTSSKAELAAIFRRIGRKETSEEGLAELAAFGRARGGIKDDETGSGGVGGLDLGPHLARTSEHFRAYIARGVARANAKFEAEQKRGATTTTPSAAALSAAAAALVTPSRLPPLPPSPAPTPGAVESASKHKQQQREPLRQQQQEQSPPSFMSSAAELSSKIPAAAVPAAAAATSCGGATSTFSAPSLDELRARVAAVRLSAAASKAKPSCGEGGGGGVGSVVGVGNIGAVTNNNSTLQALQARMAALRKARQ